MISLSNKEKVCIIATVVVVGAFVSTMTIVSSSTVTYHSGDVINESNVLASTQMHAAMIPNVTSTTSVQTLAAAYGNPIHIPTPSAVRAIYMTSWVAGTPSLRAHVLNLLNTTSANAVVIDVKDYSGNITFDVQNPALAAYGSVQVRISDLPQLITTLHNKGIYVIARIAVFQDAYFVKYRPDLAIQNASSTKVWADDKGISWIDPAARDYWKYIALIGDESYAVGFDELNFDYIRYPSDGNLQDISYPWSKTDSKSDVLTSFFQFLHSHFGPENIPISADLFGETTTANDDMGIGQVFVNALPYFNYIAPMVYPSAYAPNTLGYKNPAAYPYQIITYALDSAVKRADMASTSALKIRPWLQDFNLGATYGVSQVESEEKAVTDAGLSSWMMWDPNNQYTVGALGTK
jgi:hypothetical protein